MNPPDNTNAKSLADRILASLKDLAPLLVPPFEQVPSEAFDEFVAAIRAETGAEAVSIFLVSEDDPNLLVCRAAQGYKRSYINSQYFLNGMHLTSYVCRKGQAINASREELELLQKQKELPFSGRCEEFIGSGKFFNIIAAPILFEDKKLGVLKLENKSRKSNEPFPPEDFDLARTLGSIIGVAYQQRLSATLWNEGERILDSSRSVETYVQGVTDILTKRLNAQCASVFIRDEAPDGDQILRYGGGVGYEEGYKKQIYQLEPASSLTAHIFQQKEPLCMTERRLPLSRSTQN
jgi:transcriptional regulator with GAF, ATPase, and Fis domain